MVSISRNYFYYKWFWVFISIVLLAAGIAGVRYYISAAEKSAPRAVQGVMDLERYGLESHGTVRLDGEWQMYWMRLLTPVELASPEQAAGERATPIVLPEVWNRVLVDGVQPGGSGYATFRLKVKLDDPASDLGLKLPYIRTAYKAWVNGEPVASSGTVGEDIKTSKPQYTPNLIRFRHAGGPLDIVIQVSNYHHRLGGIWKPVELGSWSAMDSKLRRELAIETLVVGSLLSMGLYHIGLIALRRKEKGSLYFGLFCLLIGIRAFFTGEGVMYYFVPEVHWLTELRIEYVCFYMGVPAMIMFMHSLYPLEVRSGVVRLILALGVAFSAAAFLIPPPWVTYTTPAFQLITLLTSGYLLFSLARAMLRKRDGALFAAIGAGAYVATVMLDIMYYNQWIKLGEVSSYGLLVCVFMTSFILSSKSAKAYVEVETLSRQMREMNTGLEHKIRERTAELERINRSLERMNDDLARMETSRRHLLSNISHDLGTPMTLIQGYVEALIDGVVSQPDQQQKYLKLIHNRITGLNRLIADLFQLSKLEARQMDFDIQPVSADDFIRYFDERYELELAGAGLKFETVAYSLRPEAHRQAIVKIDVDRIDQVLTNVIYNAVKHTPRGGLIQLHFIVDEHSLVVQVQDNGSGIDPEDLPYIFDRFYKKDKSRNTAGGGSGLGLAIAKEIVDYHGGRIWAQSRVGQGACIAFMLPLAKGGE
ncbi:histidine kinase [Paenibacillus elgii]|uniref:histidine kinase n=2 Tax=Paenibacillus elgii TaxID=189691 RepID=A0A161S4S0_9BACL|nr:histidine kinase [Paenibacillus elgii]